MLKNSGIANNDLVQGVYPSGERRSKGPFAVIECFQKIPCNPCVNACKRGGIVPFADINDLPKADFDKCNGCGMCVSVCPGLAIFIIDETFSDSEVLIKIPYEFLPLPAAGDVISGTDREGRPVCRATVRQVTTSKGSRTPVVAVSVPKELSMTVRGISLDMQESCKADSKKECNCVSVDKIDNKTRGDAYVCRCEEITVDKLREYIAKGYTTLNEIKIASRAGMGACQGRTCRQLILNELSKATGQQIEKMPGVTFRPPVKPIKMSLLLNEENNLDNIIPKKEPGNE